MIWICREGYEEMAETWEGKKIQPQGKLELEQQQDIGHQQ